MEMLINEGEMFGLEMVDESGGELKKGTIYVTLQRMLDKKLLESWEEERDENEKWHRPQALCPDQLWRKSL